MVRLRCQSRSLNFKAQKWYQRRLDPLPSTSLCESFGWQASFRTKAVSEAPPCRSPPKSRSSRSTLHRHRSQSRYTASSLYCRWITSHVQVSLLEVSAASLRPTRSSKLRDHVVDDSFLDGHSHAFGVFVAHLRFWLPLSRQLFRLSDLVRCHLFVERITRHRRSLFPICDREAVPHVGLDKIPGYSSSLFIHDAPAPTTWAYFSRCRLPSCSVCGHYSRG
jgi:hypothetical protein